MCSGAMWADVRARHIRKYFTRPAAMGIHRDSLSLASANERARRGPKWLNGLKSRSSHAVRRVNGRKFWLVATEIDASERFQFPGARIVNFRSRTSCRRRVAQSEFHLFRLCKPICPSVRPSRRSSSRWCVPYYTFVRAITRLWSEHVK
jgi:hypothetical protein